MPPEIPQLPCAKAQDINTINQNAPGCRFNQAVEMADQCGLPRTGKTHNDKGFPRRYLQTDVPQPDHMIALCQQFRFADCSGLDLFQNTGRVGTEDLIDIVDLDFYVFCHDRYDSSFR